MKTKIKEDADRVVNALCTARCGQIYTFGNGGSSSIADHMACDWMKGTDGNFLVHSLSSNPALLSALANDFGYESTASKQLEWLVSRFDVVVLISSSGNSPNVVKAAKTARDIGCVVVGFSGFDGGELRKLSHVSVHIESTDYGICEDYHSQVMHEVARQLKEIE